MFRYLMYLCSNVCFTFHSLCMTVIYPVMQMDFVAYYDFYNGKLNTTLNLFFIGKVFPFPFKSLGHKAFKRSTQKKS